MKRITAAVLAVILTFALSVTAFAKTVITNGDWVYERVNVYGFEIDEYIGSGSVVELPYSFAKEYVTTVGDHAFADNPTLTDLTLTYVLQSVGSYAFNGCSSLKTVKLYSSTTYIGVGAFYGDFALESINLQDTSITEVSAYCFAECGFSSLALPDTCTKIGNYAFYNCTGMTRLTIPASVTEIADTAFTGCSQLVICCDADSAAHQYAVSHDIPYVLLGTVVNHSLSLHGDIGVNFYMNLTADQAEDTAVSFRWYNKSLDNVPVTYVPEYGLYVAKCTVAVAEMSFDITATVTVDGETRDVNTFSVKQYADYILTNESFIERYYSLGERGVEAYQKLSDLVKAMLDYGSRAQLRFSVNTSELANGGVYYYNDVDSPVTADSISTVSSVMGDNLADYGLSFAGSTVVYLTETTLRHYYTVTDRDLFNAVKDSVTFDGEPVSCTERDGMIYFEKKNIAASKLDTQYTLTIGSQSYDYAVLDYVKLQLSTASVSDAAKNLGKAAFRYNQAANAYFGD